MTCYRWTWEAQNVLGEYEFSPESSIHRLCKKGTHPLTKIKSASVCKVRFVVANTVDRSGKANDEKIGRVYRCACAYIQWENAYTYHQGMLK